MPAGGRADNAEGPAIDGIGPLVADELLVIGGSPLPVACRDTPSFGRFPSSGGAESLRKRLLTQEAFDPRDPARRRAGAAVAFLGLREVVDYGGGGRVQGAVPLVELVVQLPGPAVGLGHCP